MRCTEMVNLDGRNYANGRPEKAGLAITGLFGAWGAGIGGVWSNLGRGGTTRHERAELYTQYLGYSAHLAMRRNVWAGIQ